MYKISGNQYGYSGNVISFPQDIQEIATNLPRSLNELKSSVIVSRKMGDTVKRFDVDAARLRTALVYLKNHNKYYKDIVINEERLTQLSIIVDIQDHLISQVLNDTEVQETNGILHETILPDADLYKQDDTIRKVITFMQYEL